MSAGSSTCRSCWKPRPEPPRLAATAAVREAIDGPDFCQRVAAEIGLPTPMPPASLIGVDYLFEPGVLVEVEATAILD